MEDLGLLRVIVRLLLVAAAVGSAPGVPTPRLSWTEGAAAPALYHQLPTAAGRTAVVPTVDSTGWAGSSQFLVNYQQVLVRVPEADTITTAVEEGSTEHHQVGPIPAAAIHSRRGDDNSLEVSQTEVPSL